MEERGPSTEDRTENYPPPPPPPPLNHSLSIIKSPSSPPLNKNNSIIKPLPLPPGSDTFIVHYPRDQVYRVPPPENSKIVEDYIKQTQVKKGPSTCFYILIGLVILGVSLGVFFGIIGAIYRPNLPDFDITNFHVNQPPASHDKNQTHTHPSFEITFNVKNTNTRMDVSYGGDRYGLLTFKSKKVADGKFESFSQEAKKSSDLKITLKEGAKVALPSEMEKSMHSTKSKMAESLGFKMYVTAKISSWAKTFHKDIAVTCTFKVNTLAKDTRIVYQECSTEVQ